MALTPSMLLEAGAAIVVLREMWNQLWKRYGKVADESTKRLADDLAKSNAALAEARLAREKDLLQAREELAICQKRLLEVQEARVADAAKLIEAGLGLAALAQDTDRALDGLTRCAAINAGALEELRRSNAALIHASSEAHPQLPTNTR